MDHGERDHEGVLADQVDLVLPGELVEQVVDDGGGLLAHPADRTGGEGSLHEPPQAGVVGRVQAEDRRLPLGAEHLEWAHVLGHLGVGLEPTDRGLGVA